MADDISMGRKSSWFSSVKKALSPSSKQKKAQVNLGLYDFSFFFFFFSSFPNNNVGIVDRKKVNQRKNGWEKKKLQLRTLQIWKL